MKHQVKPSVLFAIVKIDSKMRAQNANPSQEDKLIKTYLQRRVIIYDVTQDSDGEQYFIYGVSFGALWPVNFVCLGDETIIELYRKDACWKISTAHGDPRLAYLRAKVQRAKREYDRDLEINPLSWVQKLELAMGCVAIAVMCWGAVELFLKLIR